ncbi:hypothetical protein HF521_020093 [Silurus meridionalis]|uniref:Chemokine interleukin-8-like domain-containing protein n=1 Tax=Silurus meridionalis TaxID=175797 RepID=A0A8T0BIB3_SILME|nr:hypothetical protein HF521_020093 [Silurus meridionalis]
MFCQSIAKTQNSDVSDSCCSRYYEIQIPIRFITGYKVTDPQCAQPGVIFILKNSRQMCVDPELEWVQNFLRRFDWIDQSMIETP